MFDYEVVAVVGAGQTVLARFTAPWRDSVPIFHRLALVAFALRGPDRPLVLRLEATLRETGAPDRTALARSAHRRKAASGGDEPGGLEIRAGPLLEAAFRRARH